MVDKKRIIKISAIILSIALVILALSLSTYALFTSEKAAPNYNDYATGLLSITANSKSENINLNSAIPMSDEEGAKTEPYVFTIKNNGTVDYKFDIKLLATSTNTYNPQYIKLKVDDGEVTTLSASSTIKTDVVLKAGETVDVNIRIWLSLDTPNSEITKSFTSQIVIDGESVYTASKAETSIDNFIYYLGNETPTISTIKYYNKVDGNYYDITARRSITLNSNEVLLTKYTGNAKTVAIPDTYTINGTTYNVVLLSNIYMLSSDNTIDTYDGIFRENKNIETVYLGDNVSFIYSDENTVNRNEMSEMFTDCTNLNTVPTIPATVTKMRMTFDGCTNLEGSIRINSSNVASASEVFSRTTKNIMVHVPTGSTTYTTFNALGASNVTITTY